MSICRNNHSRTSFNNYYNNSGNMLLWYDCSDKTTLLKSDNSIVTNNGDFVAQKKNKSPKHTNKYNLVSLSSTANSYNTTLSKPSIFTNPVVSTGFKTDSNMLIQNGYTSIMVYKPTGNVYTGTTAGNFSVMAKTIQNYCI